MAGSDKKLEAEATHIEIIIQSDWCNWIIPVAPSLSIRGKHSYEIYPPQTHTHRHNHVRNHISSYWTLWAWWRQMFGFGMGEHRTNRVSFSLWEERDVWKWNAACNWFREFNRFTDLLSIWSHNLSFIQWAAYKHSETSNLSCSLCLWKSCRSHNAPWDTGTIVTYSSGIRHGSVHMDHLGSGFACSFYQSLYFSGPYPHLLNLNGGTGEQTDGKPPRGEHPFREHQLRMVLPCCQSNRDYVWQTHTHTQTHN